MLIHKRFLTAVAAALVVAVGSQASADITSGLIGHWKLDEGFGATTAVDSAGGNDGDVLGAVTTGLSGRVDNGYVFGGTGGNKVLTTATAPDLGIDAGPMSMFAFMKTSNTGANQMHIFSGNDGAAGRWNLGVIDESFGIGTEPAGGDGSGELFWFHNGGLNFVHTDITVSDDVFHLVGVSRDASDNWTAYVDNSTFNLGNSGGALGGSAIAFGDRPNASQFPFDGTLDDMRIYNRVLSASDITQLLAQPTPPPTPNQWLSNASGTWFDDGSWLNAATNSNTEVARFGPAASTGVVTVVVDSPVTAKGVAFDNAATHFIVAGTQPVTLASNTGTSTLAVDQAGSHEFQAVVDLSNNATANIASGGRLDFNNALNLNGKTITKTGAGRLNINNQLNSGSGAVNVSAGVLGGTGEVGGNLANQNGGTVAPGADDAGTLSVSGNYTQASGATLAIELGGTDAELIDLLDVAGTANLLGTIDISLLDGFTPTDGDSFKIVSAGGLTTSGLSLTGTSTGFSLDKIGNDLFLDFAGGSLAGDFDNNGSVNGADFLLWQRGGAPGGATPANLAAWQSGYGSGTNAQASGNAVPEPTSICLLGLGGLALLASSRRKS